MNPYEENFLFFYKKPKLKIGETIKKIMTDDGHYTFHKQAIVKSIKKVKKGYRVNIQLT